MYRGRAADLGIGRRHNRMPMLEILTLALGFDRRRTLGLYLYRRREMRALDE